MQATARKDTLHAQASPRLPYNAGLISGNTAATTHANREERKATLPLGEMAMMLEHIGVCSAEPTERPICYGDVDGQKQHDGFRHQEV